MRVKFPRPQRARARARRDPLYVSASTTSVTFTLDAVNGGSVPAGFTPKTVTLDYEHSNGSCTYASSSYTCTTSWEVPAASDEFTVSAYDSSAKLLSTNELTQDVSTGNSTIAVTLWGVPASLVIAATSSSVFTAGSTYFLPVKATSYPFTVQAEDADGNAIVGPGAPSYTLSLASGSVFTLRTPAPSATGFAVGASTLSSYATTTLTATATYPSGGSTPYPQTCPSAACSATATLRLGPPLLVANGNSDTIGAYSGGLASALSGDTGSSAGTFFTGANPQALLFDSDGDLFEPNGSTSGGSNTVGVYAASSLAKVLQGTSESATGTLATGSNPIAVAFDSSGNLYVANYGDATVGVYAASQVAKALSGSTAVAASGSLATGTDPIAILFDASGNLCVANYGSSTVSVYDTSALSDAVGGSTSVAATGTLTTGSEPWALTFDTSGDLFVANASSKTVSAYLKATYDKALSGSTAVAATGSLAAGTDTHGLAFDSSGNLYVANYSASDVSVFAKSAVTSALGGSTAVAATGTLAAGSGPQQVAFDGFGNFFVSNDASESVSVYAPSALAKAVGGSTGVAATGSLTAQNGPLALLFGM